GYAPDDQADLIDQALEKLRVRRATVVGHSMGGTVAIALAEQDRRLVGKVATWPVVGELVRRFAPDAAIKAGLDSAFADDVDVPDKFVDDLDEMTYSAYDKSSSE